MAIHERVWENDAPSQRYVEPVAWKPRATHALLAIIGGVYLLEWLAYSIGGPGLMAWFFAIGPLGDWPWYMRPWTLITSTLAHAFPGFGHILINGLMLFFFGPILERLIGAKKFLFWFFVSGAIAGIVQVTISSHLALGASGALMMIFGALVIIMPKEKILVYGIIPVPFWAAGIGYALLDVFGAIGPSTGIGNFAHLTGMAVGLWLGWGTRKNLLERGFKF